MTREKIETKSLEKVLENGNEWNCVGNGNGNGNGNDVGIEIGIEIGIGILLDSTLGNKGTVCILFVPH